MAQSLSAKKRDRQNQKRRLRNRARRGVVRALSRQVRQASDGPAAAEAYQKLQKKVDQIAAKGTLHKRTAARIKSRLARRVNAAAKKSA